MALMIDRKQLAEAIDKLKFFSDGERAALLAVVYSVPAVDAVPAAHGRWVEKIKDERFGEEWDEIALYECSVCKSEFVEGMGLWHYCPNCGAKMDGGKNND